ncbi:MAG: hypothetical protein K6G65_04670 [Lachnospiraceae bacterium]|nr:hypothetical protein [Lachnospiraceae bacterium]
MSKYERNQQSARVFDTMKEPAKEHMSRRNTERNFREYSKDMRELYIDETSVYEIDTECMVQKRKQNKKTATS